MSRLDDGHPTIVTFDEDPDIKLWEKGVTPPGVSMGGMNDTTTMRNSVWRTRMFKKLKTLTAMGMRCAFDPAVFPEVVAIAGINQEVTLTWPEGDTLLFWGGVESGTFSEVVEGSQPEMNVNVEPTNQNASLVETGPVYTAP